MANDASSVKDTVVSASSVKDTVVSASSVKDTAVSASSVKDIVMSAPFKENVISESLQDDAASSPFKHTAESADTAVTCSSAPVPPPLSLSITVDVLSDAPDNHQIWSPTPPPSPGNRWLLATTSDNTSKPDSTHGIDTNKPLHSASLTAECTDNDPSQQSLPDMLSTVSSLDALSGNDGVQSVADNNVFSLTKPDRSALSRHVGSVKDGVSLGSQTGGSTVTAMDKTQGLPHWPRSASLPTAPNTPGPIKIPPAWQTVAHQNLQVSMGSGKSLDLGSHASVEQWSDQPTPPLQSQYHVQYRSAADLSSHSLLPSSTVAAARRTDGAHVALEGKFESAFAFARHNTGRHLTGSNIANLAITGANMNTNPRVQTTLHRQTSSPSLSWRSGSAASTQQINHFQPETSYQQQLTPMVNRLHHASSHDHLSTSTLQVTDLSSQLTASSLTSFMSHVPANWGAQEQKTPSSSTYITHPNASPSSELRSCEQPWISEMPAASNAMMPAFGTHSWQKSTRPSHIRSSSSGWGSSSDDQNYKRGNSLPMSTNGSATPYMNWQQIENIQQPKQVQQAISQHYKQQSFGSSAWDSSIPSQGYNELHQMPSITVAAGWGVSPQLLNSAGLSDQVHPSVGYSTRDDLTMNRTTKWIRPAQQTLPHSTHTPTQSSLASSNVNCASTLGVQFPTAQQQLSSPTAHGNIRRVKSAAVLSDLASARNINQQQQSLRRPPSDYLQSRLADRIIQQRFPDDLRRNSFTHGVTCNNTVGHGIQNAGSATITPRVSLNRVPVRTVDELNRLSQATSPVLHSIPLTFAGALPSTIATTSATISTGMDSTTQFQSALRRPRSSRSITNGKPLLIGEPIGIFVRRFPDSTKIVDLLQTFSIFGDIQNVGIDAKKGYAFIDFENAKSARAAIDGVQNTKLFAQSESLEIIPRYEKTGVPEFLSTSTAPTTTGAATSTYSGHTSAPVQRSARRSSSFDRNSLDVNTCSRTVHLVNCPHNINKPELDAVLAPFNENKRIKILQRSNERRASVFLTFRTPEIARKAASFVGTRPRPVFRDMNEPVVIEFPVKDAAMTAATDSATIKSVSIAAAHNDSTKSDFNSRGFKKSRRTAAAENRTVYVRQVAPEIVTLEELKKSFFPSTASIVSCHILPKSDSALPSSAFVVFDTPQVAAAAVASKLGGCTLPRHKRVDMPLVPWTVTAAELEEYLADAGEIKQMLLPSEYSANGVSTAMVEFVSAVSAAKAIVLCREVIPKFGTTTIKADYSSSLKPSESSDQTCGESMSTFFVTKSNNGSSWTHAAPSPFDQHVVVTLAELATHDTFTNLESGSGSASEAMATSLSHFNELQQHDAVTMDELVSHSSPAARVAFSVNATPFNGVPYPETSRNATFFPQSTQNVADQDDQVEETIITLSQLSALGIALFKLRSLLFLLAPSILERRFILFLS
ncbi:hypothetical protein QVD99_001766 [Batrachochytrium dendrobatidis]|nr:hypothetical protein QVD99_001766 [Batrachochytrium dendrobatidis]